MGYNVEVARCRNGGGRGNVPRVPTGTRECPSHRGRFWPSHRLKAYLDNVLGHVGPINDGKNLVVGEGVGMCPTREGGGGGGGEAPDGSQRSLPITRSRLGCVPAR